MAHFGGLFLLALEEKKKGREMIKKVEIGGIPYTLKSSVGTIKDYKEMFGKDYTKVIQSFLKAKKEADESEDENIYWLSRITEMNDDVLSLAYVMIKEAQMIGENKTFEYSYDEWLRSLDEIDTNAFMEVLALANAVFQRRVHRK